MLPSLKKAFEAKIERDIEQIEEIAKEKATDKVKQKFAKTQKDVLQQTIDKHFQTEDEGLDECLLKEDMDGFWKLWSKALEKGYLEHLNETKEVNKKLMGRGKVTIIEKVPQRRVMASSIEEIRKGGVQASHEVPEASKEV